jgi:lysophospholipase L1-like esterase
VLFFSFSPITYVAMPRFFLAILPLLMVMNALPIHAQEWAALNRFADQNKALSPAAEDEFRVVFMGDSITEGWSAAYPEFFDGKPYVNRGISGQVTAQMLVRFRADVLELDPEAVFILAGTNDIAENQGPVSLETVAGHIQSMAELAWANGIEPVICSVLPASHYPWREGPDPSVDIPRLNAMLQAYAERIGFRYLDYFAAMTDGANGLQSDLTTDYVHLSRSGYEKLSELAGAVVEDIIAAR